MYSRISKEDNFYTELGAYVEGASYYLMDCEPRTDESGAVIIDDVERLPVVGVGVGSKALHIQTGLIYIYGPSQGWIKYNGSSILN